MPALKEPIAVRFVALEDWTMAVAKAPEHRAEELPLVKRARKPRRASPASALRVSGIRTMPSKNKADSAKQRPKLGSTMTAAFCGSKAP